MINNLLRTCEGVKGPQGIQGFHDDHHHHQEKTLNLKILTRVFLKQGYNKVINI